MNVLIATVHNGEPSRLAREKVAALAGRDRVGEHVVVGDPANAEIILFVDSPESRQEWSRQGLRTHPFVRAHPGAVFVYDLRDEPLDSLPGLYISMPRRRFDDSRHRAVGPLWLWNDTTAIRNDQPDLLFSFQGRRVQMDQGARRLRSAVLSLRHPRGLVEDTSQHDFFSRDRLAVDAAEATYREILGRSKFVLCPRGAGTSSYRMFETMACGRVPVVLSDEWVAPGGIDWDSCAVRVLERDAADIAARLEALEPAWEQMAEAARVVYDTWFGPEVVFHHAVERCRELRTSGAEGITPQWLIPAYWRAGARHVKYRISALR